MLGYFLSLVTFIHQKHNFNWLSKNNYSDSYLKLLNHIHLHWIFTTQSHFFYTSFFLGYVSVKYLISICRVSYKYPIKYIFQIKIINSDTPWIRIREYSRSTGIRYGYVFILEYPSFIGVDHMYRNKGCRDIWLFSAYLNL